MISRIYDDLDWFMTFSIHVRFVVSLGWVFVFCRQKLLLLLLWLLEAEEAILKKDGAALFLRNMRW